MGSHSSPCNRMVFVFASPQSYVNLLFWYQFFCGFSGSTMIDYWQMIFFNLFFTSMPPLLFGVLDRHVSAETLLVLPELYKNGQNSEVCLDCWNNCSISQRNTGDLVLQGGKEEFRFTWNQMIHVWFLVYWCSLKEGVIVAARRTGEEHMIKVASWKWECLVTAGKCKREGLFCHYIHAATHFGIIMLHSNE